MIDSKLFNMETLIEHLLRDRYQMWMKYVTIIPDYMPPYPRKDTKPTCQIKLGNYFLRYSRGPGQGHFWDSYGEDYINPELALIALSQAPTPPVVMQGFLQEKQK